MHPRGRVVSAATLGLLVASTLGACGSSSPTPAEKSAVTGILTTTTSTTTTAPPRSTAGTFTSVPGVTVPTVIGLKIADARAALHAVGLRSVGLNAPCNKGTLASQSVVDSLSLPGKPPDFKVGALPLTPRSTVPRGTRVAITWSGCFGNGSPVPDVVGLTFAAARHALHAVGLTWACLSVGRSTTTTTRTITTTTAAGSSTPTSAPAVTTTTARPRRSVLTQDPAPGTVLRSGSTVTVTMHTRPQ